MGCSNCGAVALATRYFRAIEGGTPGPHARCKKGLDNLRHALCPASSPRRQDSARAAVTRRAPAAALCPDGHVGRIRIDRVVASWGPFFTRVGYRCVYRAWDAERSLWVIRRHRFTERSADDPLPRRHPTHAHSYSSDACPICEHTYAPDDGPRAGRNFVFYVTEIAAVLIAVGVRALLTGVATEQARARRPPVSTRPHGRIARLADAARAQRAGCRRSATHRSRGRHHRCHGLLIGPGHRCERARGTRRPWRRGPWRRSPKIAPRRGSRRPRSAAPAPPGAPPDPARWSARSPS